MRDIVLELVDVTREFPGSPVVRALDSVTLRVRRGELVAIVGPSGSGKSTMLNIIGTLDRPTSGSVVIAETAVAGMSDRDLSGLRSHQIGFVFQASHLLDEQTATANVATALVYRGVRSADRTARAIQALQRVGLGHRLDHRAALLSGGERQRVAIARAIVGEPAIVLADEPTGNLDSANSEEIMTLLRDLNEEGSTILVITHDNQIASSLSRRVSLRDGRIVDDTGAAGATVAGLGQACE